ncbi:RNA methyltransferase, TrmH family, group 3 [Candida parapsilosis]|uniref:rRNA methyltransferase 1, mitochondrial n=2 Tax=Candida parapsilosis TaxID=5480 RepID=G8BDG9_CANPC|nr:uncharacterized protein CPAR2_209610 [Candida parapsilosis]KAF6054533.1 RNA methyltransferase, TrmH family, group 3 [Candida parapsilosis]KAF6056441.1 RNA methyltransferase, TrmH family, group 3 [Candida parapsilosis]KAF6059375.1 RNA methyltransferase, TrmH family, group 3 [Candida parapsilosis]KAF6068131.1 RNA methyltransferase, TrmH family, group 3 [Candida parapsilosis]KAI5905234.1 rRNA methyltransferase 1 [Candida parapsilosis]
MYRQLQARRSFSKLTPLFKSGDLKPVYRPHHANPKNKTRSFQKHLPATKEKLKPWEAENISKDRFFKRKYGHMSEERRSSLQEKVARQRRYREMKKAHEKQKLEAEIGFKRSRDEINYDGQSAKEIIESGNSGGLSTFFEFVYGTHPIKSVLQARKRPILGLYTFNADDDNGVIKQAQKEYGIKAQRVRDKNALNVLSKNGVHNGLVLKTKALDMPYIKNCGHAENGTYTVTVEDEDGVDSEKELTVLRKKDNDEVNELFPLALFLDEITDPQNMGSILRTAYFFGIDFIVIPDHSSAKLGPVANKASSGALDLIDIYQTDRSLKFIDSVRENGWNVISTSAKPDESNLEELKDKDHKIEMSLKDKFINLDSLKTILKRTPVMLVIGSEGKGVRTNMKLRSDYLVGVQKHRENDDIVDSLNVGVATGIIVQSCL